jgi:undecaprenyl-diphosphatase
VTLRELALWPRRLGFGTGRTELVLLAVALAAFGAIWAFFGVADEVQEGDTSAFDRRILLAFRRPGHLGTPIGPRWLQETGRDITALGGFTVLTLVVVLAVVILWLHRRRAQALVLLAAVGLGEGFAAVAKQLVGRARPDLVPHLDLAYSSSFPSGHSTLSPVVYITLAAILAAGEGDRAAKTVLVVAATLLVLAIGVSRIYLGVHWPTDVIAGWALGFAVALIATVVLHAIAPHRRNPARVSPDPPLAAEPPKS